ncbi:MAG: hypothetical protein IAF38_19505 [Bacteroidia bacterium]|nr:hypothetical protein [Bacteroidia bacterium]
MKSTIKTILIFLSLVLIGQAQTMNKGKILNQGDKLYSANNSFFLSINADGNLIITETNGNSWVALELKKAPGSNNLYPLKKGENYYLILQTDGHLCIRTANMFKWGDSQFGDRVVLENDGRLVHYNGSKVLWSTPLPTSKFVIEMLGRRGTLEFPGLISAQPSTASIKLYGLKATDMKVYAVTNGTWSNNVFSAQLMQGENPAVAAVLPGLNANQNKLKIKFTTGTYKIVGVITPSLNYTQWLGGGAYSLVLGYNWGEKNLFPENPSQEVFSTIIRTQEASNNNGAWNYSWYATPQITNTTTYKELSLLWDGLNNEFALYALTNNPARNSQVAGNKIAAYNYNEITTQLSAFLPNASYFDFKVELTALLISETMKRYPSQLFVIKSTGHGFPFGIMNDILSDTVDIKRCLTWVKDQRGKSIDLLDFSTNCNSGSLFNIQALAPYTDYLLASDLTRYPTNTDDYSTYFSDKTKTVSEIGGNMMVKELEYARNCPVCSTFRLQITLFDCKQFSTILQNIGGTNALAVCKKKLATTPTLYYTDDNKLQSDFKTSIPVLFPAYTLFQQHWASFAIRQVNNRTILDWRTDLSQGMILDRQN